MKKKIKTIAKTLKTINNNVPTYIIRPMEECPPYRYVSGLDYSAMAPTYILFIGAKYTN
jgi:hypothetical protein